MLLHSVSQFCPNFRGAFCCLLAWSLIWPFSTPGLSTGGCSASSCPLCHPASRGYASLPPPVQLSQSAPQPKLMQAKSAHNCIIAFFWSLEKMRKCEILAFVVYERSRPSFRLATASALLLLAMTSPPPITNFPHCRQQSQTKSRFSWKKVCSFLLFMAFGDLRAGENFKSDSLIQI